MNYNTIVYAKRQLSGIAIMVLYQGVVKGPLEH